MGESSRLSKLFGRLRDTATSFWVLKLELLQCRVTLRRHSVALHLVGYGNFGLVVETGVGYSWGLQFTVTYHSCIRRLHSRVAFDGGGGSGEFGGASGWCARSMDLVLANAQETSFSFRDREFALHCWLRYQKHAQGVWPPCVFCDCAPVLFRVPRGGVG